MAISQTPCSWSMLHQLHTMVKAPFAALAKYYSHVLEREISIRQTLLLLNAQTAFFFAVLPADGPFTLRALCCGWFAYAVLKCKQAL
ncbi:MAG: ATP-binding protein [Prevotella sp.]